MRKTVVMMAVASALVLAFQPSVARACCEGVPPLGRGVSNVGGDPIYNFDNVSMATLGGTCYVMYAGGGTKSESLYHWRLFVKKTVSGGKWVFTGGGESLNDVPHKVTNPYFYDQQLVVFQDHLYAVLTETDGDGDSNGNGHKVMRVKRYDEDADTWKPVDLFKRKPDKTPHLGLSRDFWPGPYVGHWSFFNRNGVKATKDALYVAWTESTNLDGGGSREISVIMKYDGADKRYDGTDPVTGKSIWTLVGGEAVRDSSSLSNPLLVDDNDGITVVSWDTSELYVDRLDGTSWETIGTTGAADVVEPYTFYVYAPNIAAVSADGRIYLTWHVMDRMLYAA